MVQQPDWVAIPAEHIVESIAGALQYISYYHPPDFIRALTDAYEREESETAKNAISQVLINSRLAALGKRPMCQDTGMAVIFAKVGMDVRIEGGRSFEDLINEGVRKAYTDPSNPLRASIVEDPLGARRNTRDNSPAVIHTSLVPGRTIEFKVAAKGFGSENKARFTILKPGESVAEWVLATVPTLGAGWCPPGLIGIGVGGSAEKAMVLAKEALLQPISIRELLDKGAETPEERLRVELYEKVNALGIGAQGLGGLSTVLDIKVASYPTHAASLPVALIPQCVADRHVTIHLDGSGPAELEPPDLSLWPEIALTSAATSARRIDMNSLTKEAVLSWRAGETLLLSGRMLTARDAAHRRISELVAAGGKPPVDFHGRVIYYVGPVEAVRDEIVGPAGPTTATRMDPYTDLMLGTCGAIAMSGKGERGPEAVEAIARHGAASLIAVGGAAYLVARAIKSAEMLAFEDLGMEAIHEFEVVDMPVIVAVDSIGHSIHETGPADWRRRILERARIPVVA